MLNHPIATFSLVARDPETGDLGVAVASKFLAVGAVVPTAVAGIGAVATQSYANTTYGPRAIELLRQGTTPEVIARTFEDGDADFANRQFGIVAATGESVTRTGSECQAWAGGVAGQDFAAQGNILAGPEVVAALVAGLDARSLAFPERLVAALSNADAAGGDIRGRQSAALLIVGEGKGYGGLNDRWIDLRVDDHATPIPELKRLLTIQRLLLDKPTEEPILLTAEDIDWLQSILNAQGHLEAQPTGEWNEATERALRALYGMENLEERWIGGPRVDPVAWDHLRSRH